MLRALHNVHLLVEWQQLHPQCEAAADPLSHSNTIGATEGEDKQARKYKYEKTRSLKSAPIARKQTTVPIKLQIRLKTLKYHNVSGLWTCQLAFKRICVKSAQMQRQIQIQIQLPSVRHTFVFPFCNRLWEITKCFTKFHNFDQISQFWQKFTILTKFHNIE